MTFVLFTLDVNNRITSRRAGGEAVPWREVSLAQTPAEFLDATDLARWAGAIVEIRRQGTCRPFEVNVLGPGTITAVTVQGLLSADAAELNLKLEASAEASGRRFEAYFRDVAEGFIVHAHDGRVCEFNPAALRVLNLTSSQTTRLTLSEPGWQALNEDLSFCPPEQHPAALAFTTQAAQRKVLGLRRPDGSVIWADFSATPRTEHGRVVGVLTTFRDVSHRKVSRDQLLELQKRLREREQFLDFVLGALPVYVNYLGTDYVSRYVNPAYVRVLGKSAAEIMSRPFPEVVGEQLYARIKDKLALAMQGERQSFKMESVDQLVETKHVRSNYIPDVDENGHVRGTVLVVEDLTQEVALEREMTKQKIFLQDLLNALPAFIGYWDQDLKNVHANQAYADYLGVSVGELKGRSLADVSHPAIFQMNQPFIKKALRGEPQVFEREIATRLGVRHTIAQYTPQLVHGRVVGYFVTVQDVTPLKELERERQHFEAQMMANAKLAALGEMAAAIAHEINNPISVINALATRLADLSRGGELDPARLAKDLATIDRMVQRTAKIVQTLRTFSHNGEQDQPQLTSIKEILDDTLELAQKKLVHQGISLRLPDQVTGALECRPTQISQILLNLLNNAADAIEALPEKWIELRIETRAERLILSVLDSGAGIPPEVRERMMQAFYTTKAAGRGTGLGLHISCRLAEANGGELVYAADSANTRFDLILPLSPAALKLAARAIQVIG